MGENLHPYQPSEIKLVDIADQKDPKILERVNPQVQILRVGKFKHPRYGEFEITKQTLAEMKANFDSKARGIDIAFDYFHESEKIAAGWPKKLELLENDSELWATEIEWTPKARKMLADKELRYFSPDFAFEWENPETGTTYKNILFGGGLTNRPFIKDMEPIVKLGELALGIDTDAKKASDLKKLGGKTKLAEDYKMEEKDKLIAELKAQVADLQAKLEAAMKDKEGVMAEKKKLEEDKKLTERKAKFQVMLTEGKACAAQEEAFLAGDMDAFVAKAQPVNLSSKGTGDGRTDSGDVTEKVINLAEEKIKADGKLTMRDAIGKVLRENAELAKAYRG